jgi:spore maturation protein CgeB
MMRFVVLGLSLSSSWGNGHATTWRALLRALADQGHEVLFLERDVPWYAGNRDLADPAWCALRFYDSLDGLRVWRSAIATADVVIVGSYVPEGVAVIARVQDWARGITAFYDIDTPVTLARLARGDREYLAPELVPGFDLYLSFTGGPMLPRLEREWGARRARVLYCSVDPARYQPAEVTTCWDLGYIGTYSPDRQPALERLLLAPARMLPQCRFVVAGPLYPPEVEWPANVQRIEHLPPNAHPAFYSALRWTLNITRADMREAGWSPSVRLFEAAACGAPILSDRWPGLETILCPGRELMVVRASEDVCRALEMSAKRRRAIAAAARERVLAAHSAAHRARELLGYIAEAREARIPVLAEVSA